MKGTGCSLIKPESERAGMGESGMLKLVLTELGQAFGGRWVFRGISREICGGSIIAVAGPNGSGKSTLLRLCARLLVPTEGRVQALDEGDCELKRAAYRARLAMVAPELRFYPRLTARENLSFLLGLRGKTLTREAYQGLLARVELPEEKIRENMAGAFSTGMRQRLKLAALLAAEADIWLLDEPGANLDAGGRKLVMREAKLAAEQGKLVLWATNDEREGAAADERIDLGGAQAGL